MLCLHLLISSKSGVTYIFKPPIILFVTSFPAFRKQISRLLQAAYSLNER
jgi:hypothetical protein